jgi:hypothetical protein
VLSFASRVSDVDKKVLGDVLAESDDTQSRTKKTILVLKFCFTMAK